MEKRLILLTISAILTVGKLVSAATPGATEITVAEMHCKGCAKKIAAQLYTVRGVKSVKVNVAQKTLIVVPQTGQTLSPRQLCEAVENADSRPLRLTSPDVTLLRNYAEQTRDNSQFAIVVAKMPDKDRARRVASQLYTLPGVKTVSLATDRKTLHVTPAKAHALSLWALWEAVNKSQNRALAISGPDGSLTAVDFEARQTLPSKAVR